MWIIMVNILLATAIGITILSLCTLIGIIILMVGIIKKRKYKNTPRSKKKKYPNALIALGSVLICIPLLVVGVPIANVVVDSVAESMNEEKNIIYEKQLTSEEKCEIIINAVKNKEKEPIRELFCENAKNTLDLDAELNDFINFVDGNIVSYDEPEATNIGASSDKNGYDKLHINGRINNILTDTGNLYTITFFSYDIYKENPEFTGIVSMSVKDKNRYNTENNNYRIEINYPR